MSPSTDGVCTVIDLQLILSTDFLGQSMTVDCFRERLITGGLCGGCEGLKLSGFHQMDKWSFHGFSNGSSIRFIDLNNELMHLRSIFDVKNECTSPNAKEA